MKSYLIWAPPYDESSGGIKVMHRLAVELQLRGYDVSINTDKQNPKWPAVKAFQLRNNTPNRYCIAIYPEIVSGNPFFTDTIVRYLLNVPGQCSPDYWHTWGDDELDFTYSRLFNTKLRMPDSQILLIPHIDLDVFYDKHLTRTTRFVYRGKGRQPEDPGANYMSLGGKESFRGKEGQASL
jgi:hypothetical protein